MISLMIDSSSKIFRIAIIRDSNVIYIKNIDSKANHSVIAVDEINNALSTVNLKPKEMDNLYVTDGPGSFTGIRIGLAIMKTFAYSLGKKLIPVSSLKMTALGIKDFDYVVSIIDARRDNLYASIYDANYNILLDDCFISREDLIGKLSKLEGNIKITGDTILNGYDINLINFDPINIMKYYPIKLAMNQEQVNPVYLKLTEAEENLNK